MEYKDQRGSPISRGFKESFVRHFKKGGHTVVYVGDGRSDIVPAEQADFVIARSALKRHLKAAGLPYHEFETFLDVSRHLDRIRGEI